MDEILRCGHSHETSPVVELWLTEHKRTTRNGDVNNHIVEHLLPRKDQIDWDSDIYYVFHRLLSTTYFRKLVYQLRTNATESHPTVSGTIQTTYWRNMDWRTDNLTNNGLLFNCDNRQIEMHQLHYKSS